MTEAVEGARSKEELIEHLKALNRELTVEELIEILGSTVKHDDTNKAITFLSMLLTYTEEDQVNIGFLAESSTGKSYIPLELSRYFPEEDVLKLGYASPQTFYYESGTLVPDPSDTRDVEEDKKRKMRIVDLHQKILIFLDQPHDQLLQRLRSLLSHDEKAIVSKFVNKREKSGNRTETVIIEGYPTVIFCSAKFSMEEQEKTRFLLLSPETCQEKLIETLTLKIDKESDRQAFQERLTANPMRKFLAARVSCVRTAHIQYIKVPEELRELVYQRFVERHRFLVPRHQRDISKLLAVIKGHALLNYSHRKEQESMITVTLEDVEAGFKLYGSVSEANELGLSPELYTLYLKLEPFIGKAATGITMKEFQKWHYEEFHKAVGGKSAKNRIDLLESVGLITEQQDMDDKRITRYMLHDWGPTNNMLSLDENAPPTQGVYISSKDGKIVQAYKVLQSRLGGIFPEQRALDLITSELGLSQRDAEAVFKVFVDEGKVEHDDIGNWFFSRGLGHE